MELGLGGRVYVVTGGTKGLGFASAQALVEDGAHVVVSSRSQESVDDAVRRLGDGARGVVADNADPAAPQQLVQAALDAFERIDGALLSVGGPPGTNPPSATEQQWRESFESVFLGVIRMTQALMPHLTVGAAIGLVLSTSVKSPVAGIEISSGLRPGLAMWAKHLADEVGPHGVRVFSLLPGRILTDRILHLAPDEASRERMAATIPLRRLGDPQEFGRVAAFLLSPAASYLTGLAVPIDGGALRTL